MGPELIFLLKAMASGVTGHYLKKGLEKIDKKLAGLISSGANEEEIEKYINENELTEKVEEYASSVAQDSVVLPILPKGTPSIQSRTEFFLAILDTCFRLSNSWEMDLLLPGSILGPDTFSLFAENREGVPQILRNGPKIDLPPVLLLKNRFYIIPVSDQEAYWSGYKDEVLKFKSESDGYMRFAGDTKHCDISSITARSVIYEYPATLSDEAKELLPFESRGSAVIGDWFEGIQAMLEGIFEVKELFVLPEQDVKYIEEISSKMKALADDLTSG